jgi:hypothetical protein
MIGLLKQADMTDADAMGVLGVEKGFDPGGLKKNTGLPP